MGRTWSNVWLYNSDRRMLLLNQCLWFSGGFLCGVLMLVGFLNKRLKTFPIFFWLNGCYFLQFLVQFIIQDCSDILWAWLAILMTGISFPLELAVLYEVFRKLTPPQSALATRLAPISKNVLAVLVIFSTVLAAVTPMGSQVAVRRVLMNLWFAQDFLEVGLLLFMLVLSFTVGISWRRLHAGVVLGFGITTSINILEMQLLSRPGLVAATFFRGVGFNICALLWLWYVLRPEPAENRSATGLAFLLNVNQDAETLRAMLSE